jgi:hypothetical protein
MLSVEELWSLIDREISELPAVRMPLAKALGRRLGAEIVADADMPAFSRSRSTATRWRMDLARDRFVLSERRDQAAIRFRFLRRERR